MIKLRINLFKKFCTNLNSIQPTNQSLNIDKPKFGLIKTKIEEEDNFYEYEEEMNFKISSQSKKSKEKSLDKLTMRPKETNYSIHDIDLEKLKKNLEVYNIEENLLFYAHNKNMQIDRFIVFLKNLCIKLENTQYDVFKQIVISNSSILEDLMKRYEQEIKKVNSKEKVITYSYFKHIFYDRKLSTDAIKLKTLTFDKSCAYYFEKNYKEFSFSEKINFFSFGLFKRKHENILTENIYEIENLGFFELNRLIKRILKKNNKYFEKKIFYQNLIIPYAKMALEVSLTNKVSAFFYLSEITNENKSLEMPKEIEQIYLSIQDDFYQYERLNESINRREIEKFNWINNLLRGIGFYSGKTNRNFLDQLFELFFSKVIYKTNSISKSLNHFYNISLFDKVNLPNESHMKFLFEYLKNNLSEMPKNNIERQMMGIFLLIEKSECEIDKEVLKLCVEYFVDHVHKFLLNKNLHSFKNLIKNHLGEEYYEEKVKKVIIQNSFDLALTLKNNKNMIQLFELIPVVCFFSESETPQTDSIMDMFLSDFDSFLIENNHLIPKLLLDYVKYTQKYLIIDYRDKFLIKFLQNFTNSSLDNLPHILDIVTVYYSLNKIKFKTESTRKSILALISHIHEMKIDKFDFMKNLRIFVERKNLLNNSLLISIMMTTKIFTTNNSKFNQIYIEQLIYILYANLISDGENLDKELVNTFIKFVDRLSNDKKSLNIEFEECLNIMIIFLNKNIFCEILVYKFNEDKKLEFNKNVEYEFINRIKGKIDKVEKLLLNYSPPGNNLI